MLEEEFLSIVKKYAKDNSKSDDIHGFSHFLRVKNLCLRLGKELGANLFILETAALLHDIGRLNENKGALNKNHAELSAEMALNFLKSEMFQISEEDMNNIVHCIRAHSFSNKIIPNTLEAQILSDADKLDALGVIGLYRTIGFTIQNQGGLEKVVEHLETKILKLNDLLFLDISQKIAEKRQQIILDFYKKIKKQM